MCFSRYEALLYKISHLNYMITLRSIIIVSISKMRGQWSSLFSDFRVPDTVLATLYSSSYLVFTRILTGNILLFLMKKARLGDSECFAQSHSAGKGQSQDSNLGLTPSKPQLFTVRRSCKQTQGPQSSSSPSGGEAKTHIY